DGLEQGLLVLTARDEFVRDWVKEHFLPDLLQTFERMLGDGSGQGTRVRWAISSELTHPVSEPRRPSGRPRPSEPSAAPASVRPPRPERTSVPYSRAQITAALNPKHTFGNFVV